MGDTYQAIYDAVRSKISGGDIGSVISDIARSAFDISWPIEHLKQEFISVAHEHQRPSILFRPTLTLDGNAWLAIYGDLPTGVVGAGNSPAEAMADFDKAWTQKARGSNG